MITLSYAFVTVIVAGRLNIKMINNKKNIKEDITSTSTG